VAATGAFLRDVQLFVQENKVMRAGIDAQLAAGAFYRVDDHQTIGALINCLRLAVGDAWSVVAVMAHLWDIADADMRYVTVYRFLHAEPELTGIWLGFGIGGPVVADMFVFTGNLTAVAAVAYR
jgi:hypothetical protein